MRRSMQAAIAMCWKCKVLQDIRGMDDCAGDGGTVSASVALSLSLRNYMAAVEEPRGRFSPPRRTAWSCWWCKTRGPPASAGAAGRARRC